MQITIPDGLSVYELVGLLKDPFSFADANAFPLGIFWIFLISFFTICIIFWLIFPKTKKIAKKYLAKSEFKKINKGLLAGDKFEIILKLSDITRRVGIVAFGNEAVAGLHSNAWINFLLENDKSRKMSLEVAKTIAQAPYLSKQDMEIDINNLYKQTYDWSMAVL